MPASRFFNPWSVLEVANSGANPVDVADPNDATPCTLATLAGLAGRDAEIEYRRPARSGGTHAKAANDAKAQPFDSLPLKIFATLAILADIRPTFCPSHAKSNIEGAPAKAAKVLKCAANFSSPVGANAKVDEGQIADQEQIEGVSATPDEVQGAIEERLAIISETCPPRYADAFARLNHQQPFAVSPEQWEIAVNDAGLFLDAWGAQAAAFSVTSGDLFDADDGIVLQLRGVGVEALAADHARLIGGRTIPIRKART